MKKIILGLGSLLAIVTPISAVVSCGKKNQTNKGIVASAFFASKTGFKVDVSITNAADKVSLYFATGLENEEVSFTQKSSKTYITVKAKSKLTTSSTLTSFIVKSGSTTIVPNNITVTSAKADDIVLQDKTGVTFGGTFSGDPNTPFIDFANNNIYFSSSTSNEHNINKLNQLFKSVISFDNEIKSVIIEKIDGKYKLKSFTIGAK